MNCRANIITFVAALISTACLGSDLPLNLTQTLKTQAEELAPLSVQWTDDSQPQQVFWQHGCVYCSSALDATSFDGATICWRFDNDGQQVVLKIPAARIDSRRRNIVWLQCRYLSAAGWELPSRARELIRSDCLSTILKLIEDGARVNRVDDVQLDGRSLTRVELAGLQSEGAADFTGPRPMGAASTASPSIAPRPNDPGQHSAAKAIKYLFYLDPQFGDAIRRREDYFDGQLRAQVDNDEFQHLSGRDIWLPRRCVVKASGKSHDLRVDTISLNPILPNQFVMATNRIGALVSDETVPGGQLSFQIPPAPNTMEFDDLVASAGPGGSPGLDRSWALLAVAGAVSASAWLGWKSRAALVRWRY
jgi:hypothetical protein